MSPPPFGKNGGGDSFLEGCTLLEVLAVFTHIEAGTGLVGAWEFLVAYNTSLRVVAVEVL